MRKIFITLLLAVMFSLSYGEFEVTISTDDFGDPINKIALSYSKVDSSVWAIRLEEDGKICFLTSKYMGVNNDGEYRRVLIKGENGERITTSMFYYNLNSDITVAYVEMGEKYYSEIHEAMKNSNKIGVGLAKYNDDIIMESISTMGYIKARNELGL